MWRPLLSSSSFGDASVFIFAFGFVFAVVCSLGVSSSQWLFACWWAGGARHSFPHTHGRRPSSYHGLLFHTTHSITPASTRLATASDGPMSP